MKCTDFKGGITMSEEEKKAIKYFYNLRSTIDESYMLFDEEINVKCGKETIKQISLVLNLITKLQKENEEKNKQIDLMAEYIANRDNDEDICKYQVAEWCEDEEDGVLIEVCRKCIKQYFERKCEE